MCRRARAHAHDSAEWCGKLPEATLDGHVAAVRDVSFSVEPDQTCVVMDLSGSGKSTLVRCLTRLIEPTAGSVAIDAEEVTRLSPRALRTLRQARLAMVFQHFGLFPHMTVVENVAYGLEVRGANRKTRRTRANEMIALVGLEGWEQAYPSTLSAGWSWTGGTSSTCTRRRAAPPEIAPRVRWDAMTARVGDSIVGRATSATWSPTLSKLIAFGCLDIDATAMGTEVIVDWTDQWFAPIGPVHATVVRLPFVELKRAQG